MANPSVTYTFSNGTTADATQVNQNFTDLINSLTDGTKSLNIDALTVSGSATLNGNVTLGNGSVDDLTISASLASSIAIKTTNSYDIGSSTLGIQTIYFGSSGGLETTALKGGAPSSSYTFTLPVDGGSDGYALESTGSGTTAWRKPKLRHGYTENFGLEATQTSVSADSIKVTSGNGDDLSSSNPAFIGINSSTAGQVTAFKVTSDVTIDLTGAHWGFGGDGDLTDHELFVYAINDAGTLKWGVSTLHNLTEVLAANDDQSAANITSYEKVLVSSTLTADSPCVLVGWFKANFDDTNGSSEDLWTVQTGAGDIRLGPRGSYRMADIIAAGSRVTATPSQFGEYRTYIKGSSDTSGSDNAPSGGYVPSAANGLRIQAVVYDSAGTSGQPNRIELFIGRYRNFKMEWFASTGRTGWIMTDVNSRFSTTAYVGVPVVYDPKTGVLLVDTMDQGSLTTTRHVGRTYTGAGSSAAGATDVYFDVVVF